MTRSTFSRTELKEILKSALNQDKDIIKELLSEISIEMPISRVTRIIRALPIQKQETTRSQILDKLINKDFNRLVKVSKS